MPELKKSEYFGIGSQLVKICQVSLPSIEPVNSLRWFISYGGLSHISQFYLEYLSEVYK